MALVNATAWLRTHERPPRFAVWASSQDAWWTGWDAVRWRLAGFWWAYLRLAYRAGREIGVRRPEGELMSLRRLLTACWERD